MIYIYHLAGHFTGVVLRELWDDPGVSQLPLAARRVIWRRKLWWVGLGGGLDVWLVVDWVGFGLGFGVGLSHSLGRLVRLRAQPLLQANALKAPAALEESGMGMAQARREV